MRATAPTHEPDMHRAGFLAAAWWPEWTRAWSATIPLLEALGILLLAWLLRHAMRSWLQRLCNRYGWPAEFAIGVRRVLTVLIYATAVMLALSRLGVSGSVLWTALTGFTAVAAIAFFAAWSVLSNLFCSLLILATRPFRVHDHLEILENGEKPGLRGRVIDINLLYTTLLEERPDQGDTVLQVPNSQFFQRVTRRWRSGEPPLRVTSGRP